MGGRVTTVPLFVDSNVTVAITLAPITGLSPFKTWAARIILAGSPAIAIDLSVNSRKIEMLLGMNHGFLFLALKIGKIIHFKIPTLNRIQIRKTFYVAGFKDIFDNSVIHECRLKNVYVVNTFKCPR